MRTGPSVADFVRQTGHYHVAVPTLDFAGRPVYTQFHILID
jgi:hypothetical protein